MVLVTYNESFVLIEVNTWGVYVYEMIGCNAHFSDSDSDSAFRCLMLK